MMEYSEEIISDSLFQLDALLPAQYLETVCSTIHPEGEKKLMLAVLEDAISCFQNYIATKDKWEKIQFCEAEEWIFAQDENDFHFSFVNICATLDVNRSYIREGLLHWWDHRLRERHGVRLRMIKSRYASRN